MITTGLAGMRFFKSKGKSLKRRKRANYSPIDGVRPGS
jgi:hypothetical protein